MRDAEIAVERAAEVSGVEAEDVVLSGTFGAQGADTFGVETGIEFALIGIEAGGEADEGGGDESAEQDEGGDREQVAEDGAQELGRVVGHCAHRMVLES
jgi:hypothetical protein